MGEALITRRGGGGVVRGTFTSQNNNQTTSITVPGLIGVKNFVCYPVPKSAQVSIGSVYQLITSISFIDGVISVVYGKGSFSYLTSEATFDSNSGTITTTATSPVVAFMSSGVASYHYIAW
jgi:hypothetical protein